MELPSGAKDRITWLAEKAMILFTVAFALGFLYVFISLVGWTGLIYLVIAFIIFGIVKTFFFFAIR